MRLLHTLLMAGLLPCFSLANSLSDYDRQMFIETYANLSVEEMIRTGIPASITLAQAILESSWGQGTVAQNGNNYFCIKCNNGWTGPSVEAPDDEIGLSCFRAYASIEESFFDHSDFLSVNNRYKDLFQYSSTDYRNWARGLQEKGYATDTLYAEKLINLIETYGLFLYDRATPAHRIRVMDSTFTPEQETEPEAVSFAPAFSIDASNGQIDTPPATTQPVMEVPGYRINNETVIPSVNNAPVTAPVSPPAEAGDGENAPESIKPLLPPPAHRLGRR